MVLRTAGEYRRWMAHSRGGAKEVYHCGFLLHDRNDLRNGLYLDTLADAVYRDWEENRVYLFQVRLGPGLYEYRVQKRRR